MDYYSKTNLFQLTIKPIHLVIRQGAGSTYLGTYQNYITTSQFDAYATNGHALPPLHLGRDNHRTTN